MAYVLACLGSERYARRCQVVLEAVWDDVWEVDGDIEDVLKTRRKNAFVNLEINGVDL